MTIRAEDLTAEERAIVDHFALNPLKDWAYAFKIAKPWIEQRRALFAPDFYETRALARYDEAKSLLHSYATTFGVVDGSVLAAKVREFLAEEKK